MNDLDPNAQALLDSVRDADGPTRHEKTRVRRRVLARVAGVMLAASAGTSAKTTAASVGIVAARVWSAKLVVMAVAASALVAGGAATGVLVSHRYARRGDVTVAPVTLSAVSVPIATPSFLPPMPVRSAATPMTRVVVDSPATAAPIAAPHWLAARPAAAPRRQPAVRSETLEEELPLLQNAQEALRLGDTDHALALLDDHAKRFPAGALSEERRAAHALAACRKTNGPAARAEARAFVLDSPSSPLVESVRKACSLVEP